MNQDRVTQTFDELGVKVLQPMQWLLMLRTDPIPSRTPGGLWLPDTATSFYKEMPHLRIMHGTVIAVASKVKGIAVGTHVAFQRLHFARWCKLSSDGTYVGWIDSNQLVGVVGEDGNGSESNTSLEVAIESGDGESVSRPRAESTPSECIAAGSRS